ncbi:MAG: MaoC family dehydratase [Candidatus Marinimicrobia bacterium]|jgi:acyl dehydratase|nr:MaoC family dehydratase [Candidatus Neomarinimicrobiota bacterium]
MGLTEAIADLKAKIGGDAEIGPWLEMTQERISDFAQATGDFQWIHLDQQRAEAESPYGKTIAHGFLTLSLVHYLAGMVNADKPPIPGAQRLINYGLNKVRFPSPVSPGENIRSRAEVISVQEVKGSLELIKKITVEIENSEKPACVAEIVTRAYFG